MTPTTPAPLLTPIPDDQHRQPTTDLHGLCLSGAALAGRDLRGCDLRGAMLYGLADDAPPPWIEGANLDGAIAESSTYLRLRLAPGGDLSGVLIAMPGGTTLQAVDKTGTRMAVIDMPSVRIQRKAHDVPPHTGLLVWEQF